MDVEQAKKAPQIANQDEQNEISVPNWLIEVLAWIKRIEMANSSLPSSCHTFRLLCSPKLHGANVEPHKICSLYLHRKRDEFGNLRGIIHNYTKELPIPRSSPPDYILGFENIYTEFLDDSVLEFFKNIAPKMKVIEFSMSQSMEGWKKDDSCTANFHCLLKLLDNKIYKINLNENFNNFNLLFPGFIDQIESIFVYVGENSTTNFDLFFDWLTKKQIDGSKHKILKMNLHPNDRLKNIALMERIKQEFSNAIEPLTFLVSYIFTPNYENHEEFALENGATGELLIGRRHQRHAHGYSLFRCPKGEEKHWEEEGEDRCWGSPVPENVTSVKINEERVADEK